MQTNDKLTTDERELVLKKRVTVISSDNSKSMTSGKRVMNEFGVDVRKFSSVAGGGGGVLMLEPAGVSADSASDVRPGDVLLAVNGVDVAGADMDRDAVMKMLRTASDSESGQCTVKVRLCLDQAWNMWLLVYASNASFNKCPI